jgi:hypothetical protein
MRRISSLLIIGLLALAGCGSSKSSTTTSTGPSPTALFKAAFAADKAKLTKLGEDVGAAVEGAKSQTDNALMNQFQSLGSRATVLSGALSQLEAPAQFKGELATLQSSVTQVAGSLHAIEAAAAANDAAAAKAAAEALVANAQEVKTSDNALSAKLGLPTSP